MKDCATCKHASIEKRRMPIDVAFDELVAFEEEDPPFYHCKAKQGPHAGKEVGRDPVSCESYEAGHKGSKAVDDMMRRFEERLQKQEE